MARLHQPVLLGLPDERMFNFDNALDVMTAWNGVNRVYWWNHEGNWFLFHHADTHAIVDGGTFHRVYMDFGHKGNRHSSLPCIPENDMLQVTLLLMSMLDGTTNLWR